MSISTIARKEIAENIVTFRNAVTTILCLILFPASIILLYNDYKVRLTNYDLRDMEGLLHFGHRSKVARKPTPLSMLARGLDLDMGRLVLIWGAQPRQGPGGMVLDPGERNHLLSLFRVPDFSYLVKTVMSLLALFFAFDAICGEKERGTLRLMLASSISRGKILLGKWLGGYISFLLCILPGLVLMFAIVNILPMVSLSVESWLRIGVILALTLIYLSLFFLLGLLISTRTRRADTALIVILLVWLIWVIVAPNISSSIAKRVYPTPTVEDMVNRKQALYVDGNKKLQAMLNTGIEESVAREEVQQWVYENMWRRNFDFIRMIRNQAEVAQHISRTSPLGSFIAAVTTIAGTGVEDTHRYKAYVLQWDKQRRAEEGTHTNPTWDRARLQKEGLSFTPVQMSFGDSLRVIMVDSVLLVLLNFVFLMAAYLLFLRYDVR